MPVTERPGGVPPSSSGLAQPEPAAPGGSEPASGAEPEPGIRELFRDVLQEHRASIRQSAEDGKPPPIIELLGGRLGMVESVLPVAVFSLVYGLTRDLRSAIFAALVPSILTTCWRLARRETVMSSISGLFGVGLGALIAWWTGGASGFFIPGVIKNVCFALVFGVSILVRWPLVGVFLGFVLGEDTAWRHVEARRRVYVLATWVWFGMFAIRAAIQIPLLLADQAVKLGVVNIALGLPLYGLVLLLTWLIVRRVPTVRHEAVQHDAVRHDAAPGAAGAADAAGPEPLVTESGTNPATGASGRL